MHSNFVIVGVTDKTKDLSEDYSKFGYKGLHLDLKLDEARAKLPEYSGFSGQQVEVQIRSIVQDAWSEIDHKLKYKKSIPDRLKRRIVRMAAIFDLADQEFMEIRKNTEILEAMLDSSEILDDDRMIDSFSFIAVMKKHFNHYNFENAPDSESAKKIDGFVEEIGFMDPDMSDARFKEILNNCLPRVRQYQDFNVKYDRRMNPFTITRHVLYLHDPKKFSDILFPAQKNAFSRWNRETMLEQKKGATLDGAAPSS